MLLNLVCLVRKQIKMRESFKGEKNSTPSNFFSSLKMILSLTHSSMNRRTHTHSSLDHLKHAKHTTKILNKEEKRKK